MTKPEGAEQLRDKLFNDVVGELKLGQYRSASETAHKIISTVIAHIEKGLPKEIEPSVKAGEIIPFDNKKQVDYKWLAKIRNSGHNQCLEEVRKLLRSIK